jgi:hypothetical protein
MRWNYFVIATDYCWHNIIITQLSLNSCTERILIFLHVNRVAKNYRLFASKASVWQNLMSRNRTKASVPFPSQSLSVSSSCDDISSNNKNDFHTFMFNVHCTTTKVDGYEC